MEQGAKRRFPSTVLLALSSLLSAPCSLPLNFSILLGLFEKSPIFATNFLYNIMSNLLIISSFKLTS
jgi:hypothetical protein